MKLWSKVKFVKNIKVWQRFKLGKSHTITYDEFMDSLKGNAFEVTMVNSHDWDEYFEIKGWGNKFLVLPSMVEELPKEYYEEKFEFTDDFFRFKKGDVYTRQELESLRRGIFTHTVEELSILKKL